jgi:penicillin-binding protein 1C
VKKLLLSISFAVLAFLLFFRYVPYLVPIRSTEVANQEFHSVTFYDRNGHFLQEVLSESSNRSVRISIEEVSPYFLDAIVATEDKNFYHHGGVDYGAVLRALITNLQSRKIVSGASTITLQLARLIHPAERTLWNKIKEAFFAYRLEAGMEKRAILEEYINRLPMGGNLYGIESAAGSYFGISSADLTLAQATFLSSIPNSPNRLNPYHHREEIKKRQRTVLQRMAENDLIAPERIEGVLKEDVLLKPQNSSFLAPHFVFGLMNDLPAETHTVKTTIDVHVQKMVAEQIHGILSRLKNYHVTNAAALLLDNETGEVLAYVGSADYFDEEDDGNCDGVKALRQPGSTLKPFLYLLAMEEGWNPATVISDIPTHYRMPMGTYVPTNYSETYYGPVRVREALANSLNIPAVRTLAAIGVDRFLDRLHEYGFCSLDREADYYGLGLVLGGGEVTLCQLAQAYLCLARMGHYGPIRSISEINGIKGEGPGEEQQISAPSLNFLIADILGDPSARTAEFGFNSILNLPFPCYVKTGTSHRFCDNWTIGFTADYTLGVWVGNFDHTPMLKVSGVSGAGPIWANIMMSLYDGKRWPSNIPQPEGLIRVPICPLSGKKPTVHCPTIVEELIPERDLATYQMASCDMHVQRGSESITVVPAQYRVWAEGLSIDIEQNVSAAQNDFKIVNPINGAIYHRFSNLASQYQSLHVKLDGSVKDHRVRWLLNDKLIRTTQGKHSFLWQIKPGDFILTAVSEGDQDRRSQVEFRVE